MSRNALGLGLLLLASCALPDALRPQQPADTATGVAPGNPLSCEAPASDEQLALISANPPVAESLDRERTDLAALDRALAARPRFTQLQFAPSLQRVGRCIDGKAAANGSFVGFAYTLLRDGQAVHGGRGFVRAPWEAGASGTAMSSESSIHWASVTKVFTAVATLKVLDQQGIGLDDPFLATMADVLARPITEGSRRPYVLRWFGRVVPALTGGSSHNQVTFRQLLQHTSGYRSGNCDLSAMYSNFATAPATTPGAQPHYANVNYCLLELFVEAAAFPRTFEAFVEDEILAPANVTGVGCSRTIPEATQAAQTLSLQYASQDIPDRAPGLAQTWPVYPLGICGPGGYHGPVASLAQLVHALRDDAVLAPALREMLLGECFGGHSPCLGFHRSVGSAGDYYVHNGGLTWILCRNAECSEVTNPQGIGTFIVRLPFGIDAAIATNTQGSSLDFAAALIDCFESAVEEANSLVDPH